jgi:hypothetical protein
VRNFQVNFLRADLMNIPYFRGPYNPDIDDTQGSGGLLALLQAAMQRNPTAQAGSDVAANQNSRSNDSFPQVGMLAQPVSLQTGQDVYQPAGAGNAPTQSRSAGADFRQVSRAPIPSRSPGALNASGQAGDRLGLSPSRDRAGEPDSLDLGGNGTQAAKGNASSPNAKMAQLVLPDGLPFPPIVGGGGGSTSLPQIPAPPIPDSLRALWTIYQLQRRAITGGFGGGEDNYNRCVRAVDGDTDDWENFCKYLDRAQSNTVGGESQNRACWSKTYESRANKKLWCDNQFGAHD